MSERVPIAKALSDSGIEVYYFDVKSETEAPYIIWRGAGQDSTSFDDTYINLGNIYQAEYHYLIKDEEIESAIENAILDNGYWYTKGEDLYDYDTDSYYIEYNIRGRNP